MISCILCNVSQAQSISFYLKDSIEKIIQTKKADIGIALWLIGSSEKMAVNGQKQYPMQSVYKFPLALAVLEAVDKNKFSLDQKIHVAKSDLRPRTWSPLRKKYPEGEIDLSFAELLDYSVSKSDNNACDILFRLLGGPGEVQKFLRNKGINEIAVSATEEEMAAGWDVQYTNWATPLAMTDLLQGFYLKKYLSDSSNRFLMRLMEESSNSANRIKGLLPKDARVAHKTGTSDADAKGMLAAVNDVGLLFLPNGKTVALSIFVSNSFETFENNEKTIAEISRLVWDYYSKK